MSHGDRGMRASRRQAAFAVTAGFIVIAAVSAAPQFALPSTVFAGVLVAGAALGVATVAVVRRRPPSRAFVLLAAPLVFLGLSALPDATSLSRPAVLVGVAAFATTGALADRAITSR